MYKLNNKGPKVEPCGPQTQFSTIWEILSPMRTHCFRSARYDLIHVITLGEKLHLVNFAIKMSRLTVSKAFLRSRKTAPTTRPLSSLALIFSRRKQFAVSVEWCLWNPNYIGCNEKEDAFRYVIICLDIHFSATFDTVGKILIGLYLLTTMGFPALNTGVIIAVLQTLGNKPSLMDWFTILVIGKMIASLFVLRKTVSIIYSTSFALEHLREEIILFTL